MDKKDIVVVEASHDAREMRLAAEMARREGHLPIIIMPDHSGSMAAVIPHIEEQLRQAKRDSLVQELINSPGQKLVDEIMVPMPSLFKEKFTRRLERRLANKPRKGIK